MHNAIRRAAALLRAANDPTVDDVADWLELDARGDLYAFLGETRRDSIGERNRLLQGAARTFFANCGRAEQARRLCDGLARYRDCEWRSTCIEAICPHHHSSLLSVFFEVLKRKDHAPTYRQMLRLLRP